MKITLFVYATLFLSISFAPCHSLARDTVIQVNSVFPNRPNFPMPVILPTGKSGTLIVYVYGGGCTFEAGAQSLDLGLIKERLLKKGYGLAIPHYRADLRFGGIDSANRTVQDEKCKSATLVYLQDLRSSIRFLKKFNQVKRIFIWGHSFGGYLVNLLATDIYKEPAVNGFISSNGWWIPTQHYALDILSPSSLNPLERNPKNLSNILVIHTKDDSRIPVQQIDYFLEWVNGHKNYQLKLYETGDHSPTNGRYPLEEFIHDITSFIGP